MEPRLLEESVTKRIEDSGRLIQKLCMLCARGIITDEQVRTELHSDVSRALNDILQPFGLSRRITGLNWQVFLDDCQRWREGLPAEEPPEDLEWLFYRPYNDSSLPEKGGAEACRNGAAARW